MSKIERDDSGRSSDSSHDSHLSTKDLRTSTVCPNLKVDSP